MPLSIPIANHNYNLIKKRIQNKYNFFLVVGSTIICFSCLSEHHDHIFKPDSNKIIIVVSGEGGQDWKAVKRNRRDGGVREERNDHWIRSPTITVYGEGRSSSQKRRCHRCHSWWCRERRDGELGLAKERGGMR